MAVIQLDRWWYGGCDGGGYGVRSSDGDGDRSDETGRKGRESDERIGGEKKL